MPTPLQRLITAALYLAVLSALALVFLQIVKLAQTPIASLQQRWRHKDTLRPPAFSMASVGIASVGCGSDHKPAVGAEDRLGAKEPNNQGKNVSRFSHGFFPSNY
ncbi:MAG: hypothetical protein WBY44_29455 [Bryobacteraceae bacterium]|jgi:hypothetical protein